MRTRVPYRQRFGTDPYLADYRDVIHRRRAYAEALERRLTEGKTTLADFASGHEYFGLHRTRDGWVLREWAPHADAIYMIGEFTGWSETEDARLQRLPGGDCWELTLPANAIRHGMLYRLSMHWPGGSGDRIPSHARRVLQDPDTQIFNAQVWAPPEPFAWRNEAPVAHPFALIYEAHVGMAQERAGVGTYAEFCDRILPRIARAGYNTLQLMAVMEHPFYGSFGYHVANYFAASSRFGTPEELKRLVDTAHGLGLQVIMDLVHSHSVRNEVEGLSRFDGTPYQYFHDGPKGEHQAWNSRCFDYGKPEVLHFLLSNCRYWLDEYRFDGFRLDGVTSMLYWDHGFGPPFASYAEYFGDRVDPDALAYLALANKVIHTLRPDALTIAEDVSGMPGLAAPLEEGGCGFDARLAMGIPDCWFRLFEDERDEHWSMDRLWHELTNKRADEATVSYVESHDQAIVGGKTAVFLLIDAAMYEHMHVDDPDLYVERGMALHKMARLATLATADLGYLTFIGNEFGHPEWVDFPREGNNWSYHYARRQWSLRDDEDLKYRFLADFDAAMLDLTRLGEAFVRHGPGHVLTDDAAKILAVARGDLLFLFNFHPAQSVVDFRIPTAPGAYGLVLNSDEGRFGGSDRISGDQVFLAHASDTPAVQVYLPCRTAMVLQREPAEST